MEFDRSILISLRQIYNNCQLEECISKIDELPDIQDFNIYQEVQLYKGLSIFELSRFEEGRKFMEELETLRQQKKGNKIDEIDLKVKILFFWQLYFDSIEQAERYLDKFIEDCQEYQSQNSKNESYNHGIYLFGIGTQHFIQNYRDEEDLECINTLKKALSLVEEQEYQILLAIGWIYNSKQKYQESLEWNMKLYEKCPLFPGIANNLAILYEEMGMIKEAEEFYLKAESLGKTNTVILGNIANFYESQNNNEKAEEYYKRYYEINPKSAQICYYYGSYLYKNNQIEEGKKLFMEGLELDPNYQDIYLEYSHIAYQNGQIELCLENIDKCIKLQPNKGKLFQFKGDYLTGVLEYDKAIKEYKEALTKKLFTSNIIEIHTKIGYNYFMQDDINQSLSYFIKALSFYTKSVDLSKPIGNIAFLLDQDKIPKAEILEMIEQTKGIFQSRLQAIIDLVTDKAISLCLQTQLNFYTQILQIQAYQKIIQPNLTYQNEISHWDMYID